MLQYSLLPGYERKKPVARPKMGPWLGIIDQILAADQSQPRKQRHTAKRIWERLKAEHWFRGDYTIVIAVALPVRGQVRSPRERLLPRPPTPLEACLQRTTRASSQALVRFETNDYSAPVEFGHRQVLRLLETFSMAEAAAGVRQALRLPAIAFDAIKHLVLCAIERRPPRLDLEHCPLSGGSRRRSFR